MFSTVALNGRKGGGAGGAAQAIARRVIRLCGGDAESAGQAVAGTREWEVLVDNIQIPHCFATDVAVSDARRDVNSARMGEAFARVRDGRDCAVDNPFHCDGVGVCHSDGGF